MLTSINYGYKNLQYNSNLGKLSWVNNLYIIGQGALARPSASTVVYRNDLTGQQEAINDDGIPLPLDTILVANILSIGAIVGVEYHVYPILTVGAESDTLMYVAWNKAGKVSNKYSQEWDYEATIITEAKTYTDTQRRTDQQIIDIVTDAGVQLSDYQKALTDRIGAIIDEAMGSDEITSALSAMKKSWESMNLSGDKMAELEAQFLNNLTSQVINSAIGTGAQSMLTQEQGELAKRQKLGFDDNLLVKAGEQYGNTIALINSGSSNANPANWQNFDNVSKELVERSRGTR